MAHQTQSSIFARKPYYMIQFCHSLADAYIGKIDGYHEFNGSKYQIQITPQAAVSEVQTFTISGGAMAAGHISFVFRGEKSDSVANNTSAANLKIAVENMKQVNSANMSVTFNQAFSAGATVTITIVCPENGLNGDLFQVISSEAGAITTARTTPGYPGLTNGTTYPVDVFIPFHKRHIYEIGSSDVEYI